MLAANLALAGDAAGARAAIAENLAIEPGLTIAKLHARRASMHDTLW